jgi:small subunit ribosomal protein S8e
MKAGRKTSGGRYKKPKKKKLTGRQKQARIVKIGNTKTKLISGRGKTTKLVSLLNNIANLIIKGKSQKSKIKNVLETPSNTFLARQNILVKGAIIETELGKAKITNRPSQEGTIQAKLLDSN